jgi:GMP synthase (glutamine-hydrolysing)
MSTARRTVLAIENDPDCPPAWYGEWLQDEGIAVQTRHPSQLPPRAAAEYDGLIVLGGAMGAHDDARYPWLAGLRDLVRSVIESEQPILGICLGHQLMAAARGGTVARNPRGRALGLTRVRLTPTGTQDPLLASAPPTARAIQWNDDIVTALPEGGVELARAPDGSPQAVRYGPVAWGVQFHPEASPEVFRSWLDGSDPADARAGELAAYEQIAAARDELRHTWRAMAVAFARVVARSR